LKAIMIKKCTQGVLCIKSNSNLEMLIGH
jgi:hypothetical protein